MTNIMNFETKLCFIYSFSLFKNFEKMLNPMFLKKTLRVLQLVFIFYCNDCLAQNQPKVDLGNGYYRNPVLAGKYGDPSVCRVGNDYYMTHSGSGSPCLLIWHSKDLVNWRPLDYAVKDFYESAWAPDLVYYEGKFYIYVTMVSTRTDGTRSFENYVIVSENPEKGWSMPINLKVRGHIDPGHVADSNGKRYLYFEKGNVIELDKDGTKTIGEMKKVYDGWQYPEEWMVECFCLEGPKFFRKGKHYYFISAQGGTTGPSTSHMAVVARSESPIGPWENSPYNPLIHTQNRNEKWWSQGHATIIDAPDGSWWAVFHAYENGYKSLGRPTLLLPVEWTTDGFPIIKENASNILKKPLGENVGQTLLLSDDFSEKKIGKQWRSVNGEVEKLFKITNKSLVGEAMGAKLAESNRIFCYAQNHAYEVSVEVEADTTAEIGLLLYANANQTVGISLKNKIIGAYGMGSATKPQIKVSQNKTFIKIKNQNLDISLYYSSDGKTWKKYPNSYEISGFGNTSPMLFGVGSGKITFKDFRYLGLD